MRISRALPMIALLLLAVASTVFAADIDLAPHAVMCANNRAEGYAFREPFAYVGPIATLVDNKSNTQIGNPTPYVFPWIIEAWFPGDTPVTVNRVTAQPGGLTLTRWTVQVWDGDAQGHWQTVAHAIGESPSINATFAPRQTRGVRVLLEDQKADRWGDLLLGEFHIFGPEQPLTQLPSTKASVTLSTAQAMNIFPVGKPLEVNAAISNPDDRQAREYSVMAEWIDYYLRPVAPAQTETANLKAHESKRITFRYTPPEQGAYFCRVSLRYQGALVNQTFILCGSKDPEILQHIQPFRARKPLGEPSPEALVGEGKILWSTEMYHQSSHTHFLPGPDHFREIKKAGGNMLCAMPTWAAVEPLPGVYNFAYYDHCLRLAEEYGIRVEFGLWNYNFGEEHKWWLEDEYARDADGNVGTGVNRMFSLAGPKNRSEALQTIELCLKRYKDNPWVGIWQFKIYGHVDWLFPGGYTEFDYSEPYRRAFVGWLQQEKGYTLAQLAKRHGVAYKSWDDVKIGKPVWYGGPQDKDWSSYLELRPLQNDTDDFRDWIMVTRCREVYDLIRKYDSTRMIGNWLQPGLARGQVELTNAYNIPGGNNGGETLEFVRLSLDMEAPGKWSRIEPWGPMNAYFGKERALNWLLFNCGTVKTKQVNYVFPCWTENPCWDAFARPATKQLLGELSDATRPRSRVLGLHSYVTNHREGRCTQSYIELDRWYHMQAYSRWMVKPGNWMQWQLSDGELKDLQDYDLIIDDHSRIIPAVNIEALANWVERGGKLLIFSNSGEVTLGEGQKRWPLLTRLGYPVTPAQLEQLGGVGTLQFTPGNPVFTTVASIPVQAYPTLAVPSNGQVLGTIDGKPGAVLWPVGKGQVILIAGKVGAHDLRTIWGAFGKPEFYGLWEPAITQVENALCPVLDAVVRWSGAPMNQPLRWDTANGALLGYYKRERDVHYAVFINRGKEALTPVFTLSGLPGGSYAIRRLDPDADNALGTRTSQEISVGVPIGPLQADRMVAIRLERLP